MDAALAMRPARTAAPPPACGQGDGGRRLALSFEFFPPRIPAQEAPFWDAAHALARLRPDFVSLTYGAGGSDRARTPPLLRRLREAASAPVAAHLTCAGAPREAVDAVARDYWAAGVRHIVALRGDPPPGTRYAPHPGGYAFAADLVAGLRRTADFEISVAAYPETHPEAASPEADLDNLKRKLEAGAARAITQYFFEADCFLRFRDRARAAGITAPIAPGILPVVKLAQVVRFSEACGATVPGWLRGLYAGLEDDPAARHTLAATVAAELIRTLQDEGETEFHIYTLNRAEATLKLAELLGVRPAAVA
jgi:methylenetetrahydrofolate reductase (NADPH)